MADLATSADVEAFLGRSLTASESTRVDALLADASAAVRNYTGQQFDMDETTERLKVRNGRIRLSQRPVTDVASVVDMNGNDITFTWYVGSVIDLADAPPDSWSFEPYKNGLTVVDVTYTHGYAAVPDDIVAVVRSIVAKALSVAPEYAGITQQTVGDVSVSYGSFAAAGGVGMLNDHRVILDRYRVEGGSYRFGD